MTKYAVRAFGGTVLYADTTGYTVIINGIPYTLTGGTDYVISGSLSIISSVGRRSTASFSLRTSTLTHFQQYLQVSIYDATTTLIFSGYITQPKESKPGFQNTLMHSVACIDQHFLADKRVVSASYSNKTCGYIVQDILNNILSAEGVTVGQIFDGVTPSTTLYPSTMLYPGGNVGLVPSVNFTYCTVSAAFDSLVQLASSSGEAYYWQIDQFKQLYFVPYSTIVNSTIVDGTAVDQKYNPPSIQRQNPLYRNTQYITGGTAETVSQVQSIKGDNSTTAWPMDFAISQAPTITLNGTAKNVGIGNVDVGKDFYWNKGSNLITQDTSATKLISTDTLQVTYIGQYPTVINSQSGAQVSYQASLDGTSGQIEEVENDPTITNITNGLNKASAFLTRYATQATQLDFATLTSGYAPGQMITVVLPVFNLNTVQMLIESVTAGDQVDGVNIWYQIKAIIGPYDITWSDFMSKLLADPPSPNAINIGTSQSTNLLATFTANLNVTATFTATVTPCPIPNTTLFPNTTLYPC